MKKLSFYTTGMIALCGLLLSIIPANANIPGGGTGTGPNVTVTDNGDGTVTMANGVVSIHVVKSGASINQINYTYNNGSGIVTNNLLAGGKDGGELYWEFGGFGGNTWTYNLVTNSGSYAEIDLFSDSATNGTVDVHFSMLRGSQGFYITPIWSHRAQDGPQGTGEERDNIYIAPYFNWMSVNDQVQREEGLNSTYSPAFYSPQENSLVTSGPQQGTYEDKYKWSADFITEHVWGWGSVSDSTFGVTGQNVGIWHVVSSPEFYNGGPMKPDLNDAPMVNMINGGHYYFGNDSGFADGEIWTRVSGPYFIYVNNVTNTLTNPVQTSQALWADAKAQATAEISAWPYSWMNNTNYASASKRGTVTGKIIINDSYNPSASASNLWVGVEQQPATIDNVYDFQLWMKPYEFWTRTDANGNFVISNVVAGTNYTLYAFGSGASGMFMSKNQNGGDPGIIYALPSSPFTVVVTGGATNSLGTVTWTPTRVGPTVFDIGYPDRKGDKFRHGDDYWVGDVGPNPTVPSPVWTKFLEFPFDFPNGLNYVVGQNRWNTDWNFVQSVYPDPSGNSIGSSSTVTFNLASDPTSATASILMGIASDDDSPLYVTVNGTLLSSSNATGTPQTSLPTTGWFPNNDISDSNIREENHGGYSDERLTFSGSLLQAGTNTINFSFRQAGGSGFTHHFMYDYIRLELTGYVPPAPTGVAAYSGNNSVLLSWPTVAGATSYNILRTTTSGSGYGSITNGVVGPVCGSGPANATFVDNTAVNGTTYYYVVQSVNPVSSSGNSPESSSVTPSSSIGTGVPATPTGVIASINNSAVSLTWNTVPGANYYTIQRGTVVNSIGYIPFYIILSNTTTNNTYTDASGTLGCTYSYVVTASSAGGTSGSSAAVTAKPVPPAPANAPGNLNVVNTQTSTNQSDFVSWSPVSGAVGYLLYSSTNANGPFVFPNNFIQSMTTTNYTNGGLPLGPTYHYKVVAMNAGGVAGNLGTPPPTPSGLGATAGNNQVALTWNTSSGATSYNLKRATVSGGPYTMIATPTTPSYTDPTSVNGTTYYYVVSAVNAGGESANSSQVSATPEPPIPPTPTGLAATAGNDQVTLNWNASSGATSYNVKRSTTSGSGYATIASPTTTSYTDTTAVNGTTYYYVVSAVNAGGESTNSSQISATPEPPIPPTPGGLVAAAGNNQVALNWNASSGATSYNVKRSTTSGSGYATIASPTTTSYTDTTAVNGTTYYYVVSAVNGGGESANSSQVSATPEPPIPPTPTGLAATAGDNQVALTWNTSSGATSYNVKRSTTSGSGYVTIASPTTTSYTDTTAVNGTTYYYVVSAVNGGGESANSSQVSATPTGTGLPSPWVTSDIGAVGVTGSATYTNGLFTVKGSGADIWGTGDEFRYVYQPGSGDCSIQAKVLTVQNTHSQAKAGVMIRETLNTNSTMAMVEITPSADMEYIWRTTTGASAASKVVSGIGAPNWVKVTRTGNSFVGYYSTNGTAWTVLATNTITMATNVYIGLPVCAHNNTTTCTATFTNVLATP